MVVRAKFKLVGVKRYLVNQWSDVAKDSKEMNVADIEFQVVQKNNKVPHDENSQFWESTPSGTIKLSTVNQEAANELLEHLGAEFYVDFTWVEGTKPSYVGKATEDWAY